MIITPEARIRAHTHAHTSLRTSCRDTEFAALRPVRRPFIRTSWCHFDACCDESNDLPAGGWQRRRRPAFFLRGLWRVAGRLAEDWHALLDDGRSHLVALGAPVCDKSAGSTSGVAWGGTFWREQRKKKSESNPFAILSFFKSPSPPSFSTLSGTLQAPVHEGLSSTNFPDGNGRVTDCTRSLAYKTSSLRGPDTASIRTPNP